MPIVHNAAIRRTWIRGTLFRRAAARQFAEGGLVLTGKRPEFNRKASAPDPFDHMRVFDNQRPIVQSYWKLVYFRDTDRVAPYVSRLMWTRLCLLEVLFGQELLESLVTTSSASGCPEDPDPGRRWGYPAQLNLHIPSGLFTNMLRTGLVEVMYYKFYRQYLFIRPVDEDLHLDRQECDLTRVRFRLNKELLYLVIPFRRTYLATALATNLTADLLVFAITTNPWYVAATAAGLEGIRRLLKL